MTALVLTRRPVLAAHAACEHFLHPIMAAASAAEAAYHNRPVAPYKVLMQRRLTALTAWDRGWRRAAAASASLKLLTYEAMQASNGAARERWH